ncbi:MAG: hypothetical protein DRJ57_05490 [Thermoprotei archaeon]|nr:MAG: hypothetical protein DRJ57_05490 [Thermoprotei archaeon]
MKPRIGWLDSAAIMIVVFLFISIPLLAFILVVCGYGVASSIARYALRGDRSELIAASFWLVALFATALAMWYVVKWHRS